MSLRIWIHLANKNAGKALVSVGGGGIMTILLLHRVVNMKRSRTEVGRWRMQRQASRRKSRWLEGQWCKNRVKDGKYAYPQHQEVHSKQTA